MTSVPHDEHLTCEHIKDGLRLTGLRRYGLRQYGALHEESSASNF